MAHCLLLVSGSCTDGLGRRFLRPGRKRMIELQLKSALKAPRQVQKIKKNCGDIIALHSL